MYGHPEASPRMSYLNPTKVMSKPNSIGQPLKGGEFHLLDENGALIVEIDCEGELVFSGPNVSLGYATGKQDLLSGDEFKGTLKTGDIARFDDDGDYYIVGRSSRFLKLYGLRINLAEVEDLINVEGFECACDGNDQAIEIYTTSNNPEALLSIRKLVSQRLKIPRNVVHVYPISELPRSESGKIQYSKLSPGLARNLHG